MQYSSTGHPMMSRGNESSLPQVETEDPSIVVVDDDQSIVPLLMSLLATEGYSCLGFAESQGVLLFLQEMGKRGERHLPALLLLDLMMPVVSGYDIAHWLSEHEPYNRIPILVITADARVRDKSNHPGAQDILIKTVPDRCPVYTRGALPCTTSRRELEILLMWGPPTGRSISAGRWFAGGSYATKNE